MCFRRRFAGGGRVFPATGSPPRALPGLLVHVARLEARARRLLLRGPAERDAGHRDDLVRQAKDLGQGLDAVLVLRAAEFRRVLRRCSPGRYGTWILPSNRCCSSASLLHDFRADVGRGRQRPRPAARLGRQLDFTLDGVCVAVASVSWPVGSRPAPGAAHLGTAWPRGRVALQSWPGPAPTAPHRRPSLGTWLSARSDCGG
jgi:hypothetical protein